MALSPVLRTCVLILLSAFAFQAPTQARQSSYALDDDGSGKRSNKLSRAKIGELRQAFIGREFVLRINLNSNHVIYDGELILESDTPLARSSKGDPMQGSLISPAGEVSKITGMNFTHPNEIYIHFTTQRGTRSSLRVFAPLKNRKSYQKLDDEIATQEWLEDQITNQSLRFLEPQASFNPDLLLATLPKSQSGLSLSGTDPSDSGQSETIRSRASIFPVFLSQLSVHAEPSRVQRGDTVKLILEYTIDGEQVEQIQAEESRILKLSNTTLPGYPIDRTFLKETGTSTSEYRQTIPQSANLGVYEFTGSVCVNGECITRIARFAVIE